MIQLTLLASWVAESDATLHMPPLDHESTLTIIEPESGKVVGEARVQPHITSTNVPRALTNSVLLRTDDTGVVHGALGGIHPDLTLSEHGGWQAQAYLDVRSTRPSQPLDRCLWARLTRHRIDSHDLDIAFRAAELARTKRLLQDGYSASNTELQRMATTSEGCTRLSPTDASIPAASWNAAHAAAQRAFDDVLYDDDAFAGVTPSELADRRP